MNVSRYAWPLLAAGLALAAGCGGGPAHPASAVATAGPKPPGCPARAGQARPGGAAPGKLVPGAPVVATACRYTGVNARHDPGGLAGRRVLRGRVLADVQTALNGQPAVVGRYACPNDDGSAHLLLFAYRDRPVVRVRVADSGCRLAGNGRRTVRTPPGLAKRLG